MPIPSRFNNSSYRVNDDPNSALVAERSARSTLMAENTGDEDDEEHNDQDDQDDDGEKDDGRLYELCVEASESEKGDDEIWEEIREWFKSTTEEDRAIAIAQREQQSQRTPLHEACSHPDPPSDVIADLLACSPNANVAKVVDQSSWIPLHIACNSGATSQVIQLLVDAYPEGKKLQDQKGRTPLHFLVNKTFQNSDRDKVFSNFLKKEESPSTKNMIAVAEILTSDNENTNTPNHHHGSDILTVASRVSRAHKKSTAANIHDHINNMLPIHYACAYGIPTPVIKVLVDAFPSSILVTDNFGRTPLHYTMGNANKSYSPQTMQLLVDRDPRSLRQTPRSNLNRVVNMQDNEGSLPLQLLVAQASKLEEQHDLDRENVTKCLNIYLDTKPLATANFLTGLQTLPKWLKDTAVVNANVQIILNQKIAKRFPTMILMLDCIFLIAIVVLFAITGQNFIDAYDEDLHMNNPKQCATMTGADQRTAFSSFLYTGAAYFLGRELLQMLSLYSLGTFKSWVADISNWGDVLLITLVSFFTIAMDKCILSKDGFRLGIVVTIMVISINIISFLKSTLVEFAVFVNGVLYVVKRLGAFMVALFVILIAFSQIFFFIFHLSDKCINDDDSFSEFAHCTQPRSLLRVCASLMGEVEPSDYTSKPEAILFFALYVFIVIILLSNVLIAVVTDNYGVIKNERAAMVFWSNRLDFVAEMDAISRVHTLFQKEDNTNNNGSNINRIERSEEEHLDFVIWNNFMSLFFEKNDLSISSLEYWIIAFYRMVAFFIITPLWIIVGFFSAGWLWPPQVRQKMLVQRVVSNTRADVSNVISMQILELRKEVYQLRLEVKAEMKSDRQEIIEMKAEAEAVQSDVLADMMQIKEIMSTLLELRRVEMQNMGSHI